MEHDINYDLGALRERRKELEELLLYSSAFNGMDRALTDYLAAPKITKNKLGPGLNRDMHTDVFFTRPQLRLTQHNLVRNRKLARLLNTNTSSIERYIRVLLDPRLPYGEMIRHWEDENYIGENITSKLLVKEMPWMPILSNTMERLAGWPDIVLDTFTSKEGMRKEVTRHADGLTTQYGPFELDGTFINTIEEPIHLLLDVWTEYASNVKLGTLMPYFDLLIQREIDYQTGIYVIVTADDHESIKHMAKTIGFPTAVPKGRLFDYDAGDNNPLARFKEINTRFSCVGAEYDDYILMAEFNMVTASFVPELRNAVFNGDKVTGYVEVPLDLKKAFSGISIPFIDIFNNKLKWLVKESNIKVIKRQLDHT